MKELEMIKKRKYLFLALGFIIAIAIGWIYLINPAAELKDASFDEIYIYILIMIYHSGNWALFLKILKR